VNAKPEEAEIKCGIPCIPNGLVVCELPKGHEGFHKWGAVEWNFDGNEKPRPPKNFCP